MQTSINPSGQPIGIAGQLADSGDNDVMSGFSEETVNQIPFGCGVVAGTADDGVKLPSTSGDTVDGASIFDDWHMPAGLNDPSGNPSGDLGTTGIMPKGTINRLHKGRFLAALDVGTVVVPNVSRPFLRFRTDGANNVQPGTWAVAQDGGTNLIDCTRLGVFRSSAYTVNNPTGGSTLVAWLELDTTSRNS